MTEQAYFVAVAMRFGFGVAAAFCSRTVLSRSQ